MKAHELALRYLFLQSITWNDVKKSNGKPTYTVS